MHVYCLFCLAYRCHAVAQFLRAVLHCEVIQPRLVQRKWVKGESLREEHDYLPGYLFLYADETIDDFYPILRVDGVIRCLGYKDTEGQFHFSELTGADLAFASMLHECGGVIDNMKVYREGDRLTPAGGLLAGMEGKIIKVDRQRERLLMEYCFDEQVRQLWVGYDVVEEKKQFEANDAHNALGS